MPPLKIIIVGAGVGGLAAAIGLARNGHQVTVYERLSSTTDVGYAFRITANSDRCLKHLGIDTVAGGAVAANSNRMFNAQGKVILFYKENSDTEKAKRGASVFAYRVCGLVQGIVIENLAKSVVATTNPADDGGGPQERRNNQLWCKSGIRGCCEYNNSASRQRDCLGGLYYCSRRSSCEICSLKSIPVSLPLTDVSLFSQLSDLTCWAIPVASLIPQLAGVRLDSCFPNLSCKATISCLPSSKMMYICSHGKGTRNAFLYILSTTISSSTLPALTQANYPRHRLLTMILPLPLVCKSTTSDDSAHMEC